MREKTVSSFVCDVCGAKGECDADRDGEAIVPRGWTIVQLGGSVDAIRHACDRKEPSCVRCVLVGLTNQHQKGDL
jgi:hypothetical protein